jgi:hypothetical protein
LLRLPAVADNEAMEAEPPKAEPPKRKRRWFQFSLRSLMIVVTLLAVPLGYIGWQAKIVRERRAALDIIVESDGGYWRDRHEKVSSMIGMFPDFSLPRKAYTMISESHPGTEPGWVRRWIGDETIMVIFMRDDFLGCDAADLCERFPEADIVKVNNGLAEE